MLQTIPLNQLEPSPRNVRKHVGSGFADLVASIASQGLLQGLVVSKPEANGGPYLVEAGGRRLKALRALVGKGNIPGDYPVPCRVVELASAAEGSLHENVVREAMHPADEFDAFKVLADAGKTSDEIAERFGCEPRHVEQRLRLANVAPEILADYREGKANLEQMQALALTDDHKVQTTVWKAARKGPRWASEPDRLRDVITEKEIRADDTVARYVGVKAYEAAGGKVRQDLFGDEVFFPDVKLLHEVALAKLQKTVDKVMKEGWKWGEARLTLEWSDEQKFGHAPPATGNKADQFDPGTRAVAGFIVSLDYNGNAKVKRGLVRPEDRKDANQVAKAAGAAIKGGEKAAATKAKKPGEFSFAAHQRLQAEATEIVKVRLCAMPDTALALLAAELAHAVFHRGMVRGEAAPQWVHYQRDTTGRVHGPHIDAARAGEAGKVMREQEEQWRELLPAGRGALRTWCLDHAMRETGLVPKLLAFLTARELQSIDVYAGNQTGDPCGLAAACEVDLAMSWQVSEEWLATLPKPTILELVREANGRAGKKIAEDLAKLKKEALTARAVACFPVGWLPKPLRPKAARVLDAKQKAAGEGNADA